MSSSQLILSVAAGSGVSSVSLPQIVLAAAIVWILALVIKVPLQHSLKSYSLIAASIFASAVVLHVVLYFVFASQDGGAFNSSRPVVNSAFSAVQIGSVLVFVGWALKIATSKDSNG